MAISSEIIIEAYRKKLKVIEVPIIPTYGDETSNQRLFRDTITIVGLILSRLHWKEKYAFR